MSGKKPSPKCLLALPRLCGERTLSTGVIRYAKLMSAYQRRVRFESAARWGKEGLIS